MTIIAELKASRMRKEAEKSKGKMTIVGGSASSGSKDSPASICAFCNQEVNQVYCRLDRVILTHSL